MISEHNLEAARDRKAYYGKLKDAVDSSDMNPWVKHEVMTALNILIRPHRAYKNAEELYRRLTMIEAGNRIHTKKMLPCPFCGCGMELEETMMCDLKTIRYDPVPVKRHKRGCQLEFTGSAFVGQPETIKAAVEKWNRRASGFGCKSDRRGTHGSHRSDDNIRLLQRAGQHS